MFHVLPALILLLMQGPAALNRAALGERLPEVIHVLAESRPSSDSETGRDAGSADENLAVSHPGQIAWALAAWIALSPAAELEVEERDLTREESRPQVRFSDPPSLPIAEADRERLYPTRAGPLT